MLEAEDPVEYIARALSDYLTAETGITIIFESAIVPKWRDSRISFKNVFVTRRPDNFYRQKALAASGHFVAAGYDLSNHPSYHVRIDEEEDGDTVDHSDDDMNYSMFDLSVDSIDVTLSFARWFEGKGLVEDAVVKGVRGVLGKFSHCMLSRLVLTLQYRPALCDMGPRTPARPSGIQTQSPAGRFRA